MQCTGQFASQWKRKWLSALLWECFRRKLNEFTFILGICECMKYKKFGYYVLMRVFILQKRLWLAGASPDRGAAPRPRWGPTGAYQTPGHHVGPPPHPWWKARSAPEHTSMKIPESKNSDNITRNITFLKFFKYMHPENSYIYKKYWIVYLRI